MASKDLHEAMRYQTLGLTQTQGGSGGGGANGLSIEINNTVSATRALRFTRNSEVKSFIGGSNALGAGGSNQIWLEVYNEVGDTSKFEVLVGQRKPDGTATRASESEIYLGAFATGTLAEIVIGAAPAGAEYIYLTTDNNLLYMYDTSTVLNESGNDVDTRIEGLSDANLGYFDAGNDRFGVGTNAPGGKVQINAAESGIGLIVKANAVTPGNLQEWQSSAGAALTYIEPDGEIALAQDSKALKLGAGLDATLMYDGTNLLVNPKAVGTGYLNVQGVTLVDDKVAFTQTDLNEYIDSLNDGFMDYGATTAHRFLANVKLTADNRKLLFGTGDDLSIYYDGTDGYIKTDEVAASDLHLTTGAAKTLVLDTPVYNDLNIGALVLQTGGTLPGIVQILDNDGDATGIYTRGFSVDEQGSGVMEIPHDYKEGTDIVFHIHWGGNDAPTGTDYVVWKVVYSISRDGNTFPDSISVSSLEIAYDTQYEWLRTDIGTITGSTGGVDGGNIKIGDQFHFTITRSAPSVGDAYAGETLVGSIGFHYQSDTIGSRQISTK